MSLNEQARQGDDARVAPGIIGGRDGERLAKHLFSFAGLALLEVKLRCIRGRIPAHDSLRSERGDRFQAVLLCGGVITTESVDLREDPMGAAATPHRPFVDLLVTHPRKGFVVAFEVGQHAEVGEVSPCWVLHLVRECEGAIRVLQGSGCGLDGQVKVVEVLVSVGGLSGHGFEFLNGFIEALLGAQQLHSVQLRVVECRCGSERDDEHSDGDGGDAFHLGALT